MSGGRLFPWILILCCILVCGCMVPFPDIRPGTDPEGSSYGTEPEGSVVPEDSTAPENTTAPAEPGTGVPSETEGTQPATEPPATEPPATEPPVTEPPVTEPPVTEPPATEPPATEPPATEPAPTEPAPPDEPAFSRFLGRLMPEDIAEVNARTLANPSSMLYDVLGECTYAYEDVLFMLNSYGMPNTPYLGYGPFTDDRKADLVRNTNRDFLLKKMQEEPGGRVPVRYAILLKNADVRAFPTVERATAAMLDRDHDRMQETKLPYASGVLILHESLDGQWYFVQGEYYYGWILKSDATEADRASFRSYLTADRIAVSLTPSGPEPWQRLGVILPIEDRTADTLTVRVPARNEYGNFCTETRVIPAAGFSEGFLPWDPEDCAARMRALS
ncbi:MAG: SH3 domain-containing protein, partial [Lachnospiraceae bacterium]|nr:SH3 domain-containing protein [Lachnospiraceae bacterium]